MRPEDIQAHGWWQGSVVPADLLRTMRGLDGPSGTIAIVVSQDCDLVNLSYDAEPTVEILIGKQILSSQRRVDFEAGRNPRRLQLRSEDGRFFEFSVHERERQDRRHLETGPPSTDTKFSNGSIAILRNWLAKRYIRPAFPFEFNKRAKSAVKKIGKRLERLDPDLIRRIFLMVDPMDELTKDVSYRVIVYVVAGSADLADPKKREAIVETAAQMAAALDSSDGIEVLEHHVRGMNEFTLEDVERADEWDFDYLSYEDEYLA